MDTISLAKAYLRARNLILPNGKMLLLFSNSFYLYEDLHWKLTDSSVIEDDIINLAASGGLQLPDNFKGFIYKDIVRALRALTSQRNCSNGSFLDGSLQPKSHQIPLQNGILKVTSNLGVMELDLVNHTPNFFSSYVLPYDFNRKKECPTFINFIVETLPPEDIYLLQEWFGYLLIPTTLAQKFMIFYGSGANGKSVVCLLLRLLLGESNISSVPLQGFHPGQKFSLAATDGKLANVIEEIDELKTFPTARLKSFVAGEGISIEKKFKDNYLITPTARLTFATNTLPQFRDKSDGLKRRMMILTFANQILDESLQDKRLIDKNFWLESDELSGIFNWALLGLQRLMGNSWQFTISEKVKETIHQYNLELNPMIQFLQDYTELSTRASEFGPELYEAYVIYCKIFGFASENANVFGRTVSTHFRGQVYSTKNPRKKGCVRGRFWVGIKLIRDESDSHSITEEDHLGIESQKAHTTQIKTLIKSKFEVNEVLREKDVVSVQVNNL